MSALTTCSASWPGGSCVPEAQRGHPVGVDVLGGALELGERGDRPPRLLGARVVDLQQQRLVALDDQRAVRQGLVPRVE